VEQAAVADVVAEGHPVAEAAAAAAEQRLLAVHTAVADVLQLQVAQFLAADFAVGIVAVQAAPLWVNDLAVVNEQLPRAAVVASQEEFQGTTVG
jgi:hypothetical protein